MRQKVRGYRMRLEEATILVVDDEPDLREVFSAWLQQAGCLVFTAANGAEALEVLDAQKIDALVSDIRMPVMDGIALVQAIYEKKTRDSKHYFGRWPAPALFRP